MKRSLPSFGQHILPRLALGVCLAVFLPALTGLQPHAHAATATLHDFSDLVEKAGPAVVNIRTMERVAAGRQGSDEDEQMREFFRHFFGVPAPRQKPSPAPKEKRTPGPSGEEVPRGVGSGFIVSADGYILTNAHVVDGADEVYVKLTDRREFKARIIGVDTRTDVAVVKIEGSNLPKATIGESAKARVGEWVIAIGSPFDLDNSVTAGIISAKSRETGDFLPLIQTDVAVNPGNSGGPLINMRGEVVGINSQIYSRSGGYMGISFAIPIEEAMRVAEQLKVSGRVTRGRLGVYLGDVSRDVAESLGLPKAQGGLVGRMERGGPAEKAGLREGDIILKFNGTPVERSAELRRLAAGTKPGTRVTLTVWRKGAPIDIPVTLAELEPEKPAEKTDVKEQPQAQEKPFGITATDLTATQKEKGQGVAVESAEGPAARAGLRPGDVIISINNTDIGSVNEFIVLAAHADTRKPVVLLVRRGDNSQYVVIRPASR
jgi:serine protease Do